jgi:hypothetical protein
VFDYLSPEEVTAAYLYLLLEPPARVPSEAPATPERPANLPAGSRPKL